MIRIVSLIAVVLLAIAVVLVNPIQGQQTRKKINMGDPCPAFTALPGVNGKRHSLSDYKKTPS